MPGIILLLLRGVTALARCLLLSHWELAIENIALRQQLAALKKEKPRPKLSRYDRVFWVILKRLWRKWKGTLFIVKPETVVHWHRKGYRIYWTFLAKKGKRKGRKIINSEIRKMIRHMAMENPTWRAPRIHGELLKLGYTVSERTVSRYLPKIKPMKGKPNKWTVFLKNECKGIAAMDFFTIPTWNFRQLVGFFIIDHETRRILHIGATFHPTAKWVAQQIREAFAEVHSVKWMIHDRDSIFSAQVMETLKALGIESKRTDFRSPWQNGIAERWVGNCRRELLDHVIILNERHLYKLLEEYIDYYNNDRPHYSLEKESPEGRPVQRKESDSGKVIALPRVGGLHHKYIWKKSA